MQTLNKSIKLAIEYAFIAVLAISVYGALKAIFKAILW